MTYAVIGFIWVALGLFVGTYTEPRRGRTMAVVWGVVTFITGIFGLIVWAIYMGVSGRNRPPVGGYQRGP